MTWNIKVGSNSSLEQIARILARADPDIVLLQEVDVDVARSGRVDQARVLAQALGQHYVFAPTIELEGGTYGIAVLSRLPIESVRRIPLTNQDAAEHRTAVELQLCVGQSRWRVINHHADFRLAAARRSVDEVLRAMATEPEQPTLFAGDFNQRPSDAGPTACKSSQLVDAVAPFDPSPTFGSSRLDYVFANAQLASQVLEADVLSTDASDHRPIVVDLTVD